MIGHPATFDAIPVRAMGMLKRCSPLLLLVSLVLCACGDSVTAVPIVPSDVMVQDLPALRELVSDAQDRIIPQFPPSTSRNELAAAVTKLSLALAVGTMAPVREALTLCRTAVARYATATNADNADAGLNAELDAMRLQFDAIEAQLLSQVGSGK